MLPFFLDGEESFGVTGGRGLVHARERLPEFFVGVGYQRLQGTLVDHRDDTTFHAASKEVSGEGLALLRVEFWPTTRLASYIREHVRERLELDESVQGEGHSLAVFCDDCGRRDQRLQGNLLGGQWKTGKQQPEDDESICDRSCKTSIVHHISERQLKLCEDVFPSLERVDPRNARPDDQRVNVVRSLVDVFTDSRFIRWRMMG